MSLLHFCCLVLLCAGSWAQSLDSRFSVDDCPIVQGPQTINVYQRSCFQFFTNTRREFAEAESICRSNYGTLAMPKTQDIQDFLIRTLVQTYHFKNEVWIGLDDRKDEGVFRWADGLILHPTDFTKWKDDNGHRVNYPDIKHYLEDCVVLDTRDLQWHDYHCENHAIVDWFKDYKKHFVCEYTITKPYPTTPAPTRPTTTTKSVETRQSSKPTAAPTQTTNEHVRTAQPPTAPPGTTKNDDGATQATNRPTTGTPESSRPTTADPTTLKSTACPPFYCNLPCGMVGFMKDDNGCNICECAES